MTEFLQTAKENLSFLLICLLVFAGLVLVAWLAQHFLVPDRRQISPARRVSYVAMFSAVAAVLHIIDFPLFFAPSFYKIDFSEISVLICAFYLGPVSGVVCELLKIILQFLGVDPNFNYIVQGLVVITAVAMDIRKYVAKK